MATAVSSHFARTKYADMRREPFNDPRQKAPNYLRQHRRYNLRQVIMWSTIVFGNSRKFVFVSQLIVHRSCTVLPEHLVFERVETSFAATGHFGTLTSLPKPRGTRPERAPCTGARVPGVMACVGAPCLEKLLGKASSVESKNPRPMSPSLRLLACGVFGGSGGGADDAGS